MRRFTHLVVLIAFIFSCGGQWPVLQGVAWVNMIREYSEMVPFTQAVQMTLSGQYPCAICKAIAEKKESENNKVAMLFQHEKKIASSCFSIMPRDTSVSPQNFVIRDSSFNSRTEAPPTPPPRFA
jgi:hypothetical protein